MNGNKSILFLALALSISLASCSGFPVTGSGTSGTGTGTGTTGTGTGSTNGDATVSLTMQAAPLTPPTSISILSFTVDVTGITLTPTTGSAVTIPLNNNSYTVDLTKLQSDSAFLGSSTTVPVGSYTSVEVTLSNPVLWYCASTQGTSGCSGGALPATGLSGEASVTTSLTLSADQQTGLAMVIDLTGAITISSQGVPTVDLAAQNVLSVNQLPAATTSLPSKTLDFVEDVTGVVTTVNASAQSVTVQTATQGNITATASSATIYSANCTSQSFSCVQQGQVVSIDTTLDADGSLTLTEYDPLAQTTGDWVEGIVTAVPSSSTQFQIVANSLVVSTSGSVIGNEASDFLGAPVQVTLASPNVFTVDTKGLTVPATNFTGTDASILLPGQTVAVHVTSLDASGSPVAVNADTLILRFTRVTGIIASSSNLTFSIESLPPVFGVITQQIVQLSAGSPSTNFDGVTNGVGLSSGQTVSMRALYFGTVAATPFSAAKVRVP